MRLFKSANKSQASLDRLSGSRDHSPTQQPDPTYPHPQTYSGPPPPPSAYTAPQYQQQSQPPHLQQGQLRSELEQRQRQAQQQQQLQEQARQQQQNQNPESYYTEVTNQQQHPAHIPGRTQSNRAGSGPGDIYAQEQQPTVKIVPPTNHPVQQNQYISSPPQTQFGQSQTVRTEKDHKKSKRSIFGFSSSKREDKEDFEHRRSVGRASSILKKGGPNSPQPQQQASPKTPSTQYPDPRQVGQAQQYSNENLPDESEQYNRYREPSQDQFRPQEQFESPQSQQTRQSVQYIEDSRYHSQNPNQQNLPPQQEGRPYPLYQLNEAAGNSDNNLPYQGSRTSASTYDTNQALRPPSQTSLGPPSPLAGQQLHDSRPSTSNTQQQRYSTQSQAQSASQQQQQPQQPQQIQQPTQQQPQQPQQPQLQQPQPQHHQQAPSLPPSQQPTPQPTPQPQTVPPPQQQSQPPLPQPSSAAANMPRNDAANGRRQDEHLYSQQDPRIRTHNHEQGTQGRSTPPPNRAREDLSSLDYGQLLAKHEELQAKYSKVKRYYFEREAQVTQLQNTVANQRLSMSKTSLDDAGYTMRFERLNGAIQNLSFNIRKDWRRVPNWLTPVCNRDAHNVGTKEMTAVGRACITRWLYESIFERVFHPGIDPNLSAHLKAIERTLRRGQYGVPMTSEQQDDLLTKITTWRLTTVEGLQDVIASRQSEVYTETLVMGLTKQLEAYLRAFLVDPPPAGLTDGLGGIVGQTISIAQNIPLESRDICIEYFMPGSHISEAYMRLEGGMTILTQPGSAPTASDPLNAGDDSEDQLSASSSQLDANINVEDAIRESAKAAAGPGQSVASQRNESVTSTSTGGTKLSAQASNASTSKEKKGFLGGFVNKKPQPTMPPSQRSDLDSVKQNDGPDHGYNLQSLTGGTTDGKIRFAAFLAVEVRGRNVLKDQGKETEKVSSSSKDGDDKKDLGASAAGGVTASSQKLTATNVLYKAPVYAFE